MKRSVITYWISPEEEEEFLRFVSSTGPVVAYSPEWKAKKTAVVPQRLEDYVLQTNPAQMMIAPENAFAVVECHDFGGNLRYNVTAEQSAVITYRRGHLNGGKLGQSNLAFYYDVKIRPPEADRSIQAWGKELFRWIKDRTPNRDETGNYRLTSGAKQGVEKGAWKLAF